MRKSGQIKKRSGARDGINSAREPPKSGERESAGFEASSFKGNQNTLSRARGEVPRFVFTVQVVEPNGVA
jgi:hypothetical protein